MTTTSADSKQTGVRVNLSGTDGNVFALIGACSRAARKAGISSEVIAAFQAEVMACGSYDEALQIMMAYFDVC